MTFAEHKSEHLQSQLTLSRWLDFQLMTTDHKEHYLNYLNYLFLWSTLSSPALAISGSSRKILTAVPTLEISFWREVTPVTLAQRCSGNYRRRCSLVAKLFYLPGYSSSKKDKIKQLIYLLLEDNKDNPAIPESFPITIHTDGSHRGSSACDWIWTSQSYLTSIQITQFPVQSSLYWGLLEWKQKLPVNNLGTI